MQKLCKFLNIKTAPLFRSVTEFEAAVYQRITVIGVDSLGITANDAKYSATVLKEKKIQKYLEKCEELKAQLKKLNYPYIDNFQNLVLLYMYYRFIPNPWNIIIKNQHKDCVVLQSNKNLTNKMLKFIKINSGIDPISKRTFYFPNSGDCNLFLISFADATKDVKITSLSELREPIDDMYKRISKKVKRNAV